MRKAFNVALSTVALSITALCLGSSAQAQDVSPPPGNLERLSNFRTTGEMLDIPTVPQPEKKAQTINKTLSQIKLPQGFSISLYAMCRTPGTWRSVRRGS
jgi:hypothetical protein